MKVIAFEPDSREFSRLRSKGNIKYLNYALYDKSQNLKYYVAKEPGKSSLFKANMDVLSQYENSQRYKEVKEEIISSDMVSNLDFIVERESIADVDFIKLDAQGSELKILEGGQKNLIPKVFGAQIEVEFIPIYIDQPLFRHIDEFMDNRGFQLIDIKRHYWKRREYYNYSGKGQLIFGDALYFKKIGHFYKELSNTQDALWVRSKIIKSILICMVYEVFDYAVAVAKAGLERKYLSDSQYQGIVCRIKKYSLRGFIRKFPLNMKIYNAIRAVLKKFKPRSYLGWADSDREIANIKDK